MDHQALDQACKAKGPAPIRRGQPCPFPAPCLDLEPGRAAALAAKYPRALMGEAGRELRDALEDFGGSFALLRSDEDDVAKLLERGQLWGPTHRVMKGMASQCHMNAAMLFEANQDSLVLATGYALSDDGLWSQHSWCLLPLPRSTQVVETTAPRLMYFGYALGMRESIEFCDSNSPHEFEASASGKARFAALESGHGKPAKARRTAP